MKLKKLIFPLLSLVALSVSLYILSKDSENNADQPFSEFSFADTAAIDKITISNTLGDKITIHKRNEYNKWKINDTDVSANKEKINRILSTIHSWKVIQNIDKKNIDGSIKQLSVKHKKLEVFTNGSDKAIKTYYIGDANKSMTGNVSLLKIDDKKSNIPYYVHLPGFYGTLETRFFVDFQNWRSTEIIGLNTRDIKSIELKNHQFEEESYRLENKLDIFSLYNSKEEEIENFDTLAVRRHLVTFKILHLESFVTSMHPNKVDSIIKSQPLYTLSVTNNLDQTTKVTVFCKANESDKTAPDGNPLPCDPQRLYALVNDKEFVTIQVFGWGPVFKPLSFFTTD